MYQNSLELSIEELFSDILKRGETVIKVLPPSKENTFQKIVREDVSAVDDFIDLYGDFVWNIAKRYSDSPETAEKLTREIFLDLWRLSARFDIGKLDERSFVALVAACRLVRK